MPARAYGYSFEKQKHTFTSGYHPRISSLKTPNVRVAQSSFQHKEHQKVVETRGGIIRTAGSSGSSVIKGHWAPLLCQ